MRRGFTAGTSDTGSPDETGEQCHRKSKRTILGLEPEQKPPRGKEKGSFPFLMFKRHSRPLVIGQLACLNSNEFVTPLL